MDSVLQSGAAPPVVRVRIIELIVPETPSTPLVAVIEAEVGGQPLLDQLRMVSTSPKAPKAPRSSGADSVPMVNGRTSPVTTGLIEKSRTVIVKDEPTANGVSGKS